MKHVLFSLSLLFALSTSYSFSQKIIPSPKTGLSTIPYNTIKSIELNDSATIINFHLSYQPGGQIWIPGNTYIQAVGDTTHLYIKSSEDIPIGKGVTIPQTAILDYSLIFPSVDPSTSRIDYGEPNGQWHIYNIQLKEEPVNSVIPAELSGNWYLVKDGSWELGLYDSLAVYNGKTWHYGNTEFKRKKASIQLVSDHDVLTLQIKRKGKDNYLSDEHGTRQEISHTQHRVISSTATAPVKNISFVPDSAIVEILIRDYVPRAGIKTGNIYVNNILKGDQDNVLIEFDKNGLCRAQLPLSYPHSVFIRNDIFSSMVYLEPGDTLFCLYDPSSSGSTFQFMGDNDLVNYDLTKYLKKPGLDYSAIHSKILETNCDDYKAEIEKYFKKDLDSLDHLKNENLISGKAYQIKKTELIYIYYSEIIGYELYAESAYYTKTKTPLRHIQDIPGLKAPGMDYYTFIDNELANNPAGVKTVYYEYFLNRLQFISPLTYESPDLNSIEYTLTELKKTGYIPTADEEELGRVFTGDVTRAFKAQFVPFMSKYSRSYASFKRKYADLFKEVQTQQGVNDFKYVIDKLKEKGINLSPEEKEMTGEYLKMAETEAVKNYLDHVKIYGEQQKKFFKDHQEFISSLSQKQRTNYRNTKMKELFGIEPGLATDVMYTQELIRKSQREYKPISDELLDEAAKHITTPSIVDYMVSYNENFRRKIEAQKKNTRFNVHVLSEEMSTDSLFEEIIHNFEGKVVFVDFWGTWCGPCRNSINRMKPLKSELADSAISFIYVTGPSSPRATWEDMITGISGEHYYLTDDEWNKLTARFNVTGIPHYVLVDKKGQIVDPNLPHMAENELKNKLLHYINE